jgi:hypothetical protein
MVFGRSMPAGATRVVHAINSRRCGSRARMLRLLPLLLLLICVTMPTTHAHETATKFSGSVLFNEDELSFRVPVTVDVALLGFAPDAGGGDAFNLGASLDAFHQHLQSSLSMHRPACVETAAPSDVVFNIEYNVFHGSVAALRGYEQRLATALRSVDDALSIDFDVDVVDTDLEQFLHDEVYLKRAPPADSDAEDKDNDDKSYDVKGEMRHMIVLVNPDVARVFQLRDAGAGAAAQTGKRTYAYRYGADSAPSQTWLSRHRFFTIDLQAGPAEFGATSARDGTVAITNLPRVPTTPTPTTTTTTTTTTATPTPGATSTDPSMDAKDTATHVQFSARLAATVVSCVRHVLLPDTRFVETPYAAKLVVPVIVFRNHRRFDVMAAERVRGAHGSVRVPPLDAEVSSSNQIIDTYTYACMHAHTFSQAHLTSHPINRSLDCTPTPFEPRSVEC